MKKKYKLFCTVTMESYEIKEYSEHEAIRKLSIQLNVPMDCIDIFR